MTYQEPYEGPTWSFDTAIELLRSNSVNEYKIDSLPPTSLHKKDYCESAGLGDFSAVWQELGISPGDFSDVDYGNAQNDLEANSLDLEFAHLVKGVKWRDEYDGADLEDNVEPEAVTASNLRTRKRAARRARARERELKAVQEGDPTSSDSATDGESGQELESLRRSPDRRAVIASLLGRPRPGENISPPTSPSPPKESSVLRTPTKEEWPIANPFL